MFKVVRKMQGKSTEGTLVYASSEIDEAIEKLYVTTYLSNQTNCQQT